MNKPDSTIPELNPLYYAILCIVGSQKIAGRHIRDRLLDTYGRQTSLPAFYGIMHRLEAAGYLRKWTERRMTELNHYNENMYEMRPEGHAAVEEFREFAARTTLSVATGEPRVEGAI